MLLFIIFGTRGVSSTKEQGNFHCPQCEQQRAYKHKKVTRFFTLYFIPLIPLGKIGEYVECQTCKGTFIPNVKNYQGPDQSEQQFLSEYEKAIKHSMVLMMLADGEIDQREKEAVVQTVNKFGHNDINMQQLDEYIDKVQGNPEPVSKYLHRIQANLNGHGKEMVIKSALAIAAADGNIDPEEVKLLKEMADALDMSAAHLKGIMNEMAEKQS